MRLYSAALTIAVLILPAALGPAHSAHGQSPNGSIAASHRVMVDMTGRKVVLPTQIHRIVTIGPVPVLNSFVFALGAGDEIANGLPVQFSGPHYRFETRFQPSLLSKPRLQGSTTNPDLEAILKVMPDVAITLDPATGDLLEKNGIPAVVLVYRVPDDLKRLMRFLGEVLNRRAAAEEYVQYLDQTIERVGSVVAKIPKEQRPRVLYFQREDPDPAPTDRRMVDCGRWRHQRHEQRTADGSLQFFAGAGACMESGRAACHLARRCETTASRPAIKHADRSQGRTRIHRSHRSASLGQPNLGTALDAALGSAETASCPVQIR